MRFNLAQVLKMDYVGALVGALLWTFLLVRYLSIDRISFVLGLTTIASAILCFFLYRKRLSRPRARLVEIFGGALLVTVGLITGRDLTLKAEQFLYRDPIVASLTTPFQHIILTENRSGNVRCYINGHLQFNEADEQIYHENLVHPALHLAERKENILILGGGDGLALREVLKYPQFRAVTLVDLDPMMTELAASDPHIVRLNSGSMNDPRVTRRAPLGIKKGDTYQNTETSQYELFPTNRHPTATLHVVNLDAAEFVKSVTERYDGRPFYDHLDTLLNPGAVVVQQSGGCFQAREAYLCIGRTLKAAGFEVVPYHDNVPSFGEWGWWIAVKGRPTTATRAALATLKTLEIPTRYLTPELVAASLVFGKNQLDSSHQDFTSLTEPRVYHYHLQGWNIEEIP
jgi:spermidine synthase